MVGLVSLKNRATDTGVKSDSLAEAVDADHPKEKLKPLSAEVCTPDDGGGDAKKKLTADVFTCTLDGGDDSKHAAEEVPTAAAPEAKVATALTSELKPLKTTVLRTAARQLHAAPDTQPVQQATSTEFIAARSQLSAQVKSRPRSHRTVDQGDFQAARTHLRQLLSQKACLL